MKPSIKILSTHPRLGCLMVRVDGDGVIDGFDRDRIKREYVGPILRSSKITDNLKTFSTTLEPDKTGCTITIQLHRFNKTYVRDQKDAILSAFASLGIDATKEDDPPRTDTSNLPQHKLEEIPDGY